MAGSDTDSEYESDAPGPSTKKKLRTEIVHKKCVTTYSRQDFKPSETQSTDNESRRGSPLQIIGDVVIEHDNNQMEVDDENPTIDHVQKPRQIIRVRLNKAPKTSAERGREFRARKARLKQQSKQQQESDAIVEIATEDIRNAGPSEDNQVPGPSEIRTIEKRAKSAEATRRWREKKKGVSESSKKQAKTAAQRMREYRERKKLANKILLKQQSDQDLDAIVSTSSSQVNQRTGPSTINSISAELTRGNSQSQQQIKTSERTREYRERRNDNINIESNNPLGNNEEQSDLRDSTLTLKYDDITKHSDPVIDSSNILFLSETWSNDDENVDIPNFDCIAKFKRKNVRSAGVAIYQKSNDVSNIVTSKMDILLRHVREIDIGQSSIGDICAAHCVLDDGTNIIMAVAYISPNNTVNNIIKFLYKRLMIYGRVGSEELGENYHTLPLILAGYFNVNFASEDGQLLVKFLQDKLELQMNNNRNEPTTRHGTTIDAVFSRYLSNFHSKTYVSYFSYHKPIVSVLQSTTVITDVSDNENNE